MSQYLDRLESRLAAETDIARRAELEAQRAAYIARVGAFAEARETVSRIREQFGRGQNGRVAVRVMLAEGLIQAFERYSAEGLDRVMRAQALAIAMRYGDLTALTSAWRAHCQSERSEFAGMSRSLRTALDVVDDDDHDSIARVAMTLANAFASCGEGQAANAWYSTCRHHALEAGDRATIEAMLYNRASFALAWIRAEACLGSPAVDIAARIRRELASARNLHAMEGVAAGTSYMQLWEARALIATGSFPEAMTLLKALLGEGQFAEYNVSAPLIQLEIAYCMSQLGDTEQAAAEYSASSSADFSHLHDDEQLAAAWMLAELAKRHPTFGEADHRQHDLDVTKTLFRNSVAELKATLDPFRGIRLPGVPAAVVRALT